MNANKKLTIVIKGRSVQNAQAQGEALTVTFSDGSTMKVKTGGGQISTDALSGKTVQSVQQQGTVIRLTFSDNSTVEIPLAEATSSVMLRDAKGALEYAD